MIIAATKAAETATSERNTVNHHHQQHHQSQRTHNRAMTPATKSIVCLFIVASVVIAVSETAATGGDVSCGTAAGGGTDSGKTVVISGGVSSLREGRSSQDAEKLRSLLRMKPAEKARCRWQAEECNPYTAACCQGMRCANYMGGFCMASYEKCICFPSRGPEDNN